MRPPAESPSPLAPAPELPSRQAANRRGLLLVEAVLCAAVIGLGLVFISRSFSGYLRALKTMENTDVLVSLARSTLAELEAGRTAAQPTSIPREGTFESPHEAYGWTLAATPQGAIGELSVSRVDAAVHPAEGGGPQLRLSALWPQGWVPDSW